MRHILILPICFFCVPFITCSTETTGVQAPFKRQFVFDDKEFNFMRAKWEETKPSKYRFTLQVTLRHPVFGVPVTITVLNGNRIEPETIPEQARLFENTDTIDGIYDFIENRIKEDKALYDKHDITVLTAKIIYDDDNYFPDTIIYNVTPADNLPNGYSDTNYFTLELGGFRREVD